MVARGTGHRRKLFVPMWGDRGARPLHASRRGGRRGAATRAGRGVVALRSDAGQAAVETVAVLPILMLIGLVMGQGALAGYTAWTAAGAARIGARAEALGEDPNPAARRALPRFLRAQAKVVAADAESEAAGRITVRLRIPSLLPGVAFGTVRGRAQLPTQVGA